MDKKIDMAHTPKRLGDHLVDLDLVRRDQVEDAFLAQKHGDYPSDFRLGDILIARKQLTRAQLDRAIEQKMLDQLEAGE